MDQKAKGYNLINSFSKDAEKNIILIYLQIWILRLLLLSMVMLIKKLFGERHLTFFFYSFK